MTDVLDGATAHVVVDARTRVAQPCEIEGRHVVVALQAGDVVLCRSNIRGLGPCHAEVPLKDDGLPPALCPRCRQPMPWFGTMEVSR